MKKPKLTLLFLVAFLFFSPFVFSQSQNKKDLKKKTRKLTVDTRVDNMKYWTNMAKLGLTPVAPDIPVPKANFTGSKIKAKSVRVEDSPDVPLTEINSTQSENSVFVDPNDKDHVLNSNNSTENPVGNLYGANDLYTSDGGESWEGEVEGAGGSNSGDPTTAINRSGRMFVGYIDNSYGQGVAYSDNSGQSWTTKLVAPSPGGNLLDKNHLWIDNSITSPYVDNLYDAWTAFGGANENEIEVSCSSTNGENWSSPVNVSSAVNAGSHNQGVNLHTGPNGEVYAIWAIYDGWPTDESAIGFAKSLDGGATWQPGTRIVQDIRGIRTSETSKNQRVNSFPSMTVDISNGPNRGTIYVVWTNIGVPGVNTGNDIDVYMIKSSDLGATWSAPAKVNQDPSGLGKEHYFPWICCDDISGTLSVIYYDDRNVLSAQCEVYVSNSTDGGASWEDFKVSDVSFTPQPIAGLASSYFGDYLGITSHERKVYPVWTDNRSGHAMAYASPFETGPPPNQAWIIYQSNQINDIAGGNGNGELDFGENILLGLGMINIGDQPATNVNVSLSTTNTYITITDGTETFGSFNTPDTVYLPDVFAFTVAPNIPDGTIIQFDVNATDGDSTWISKFNVIAHAPALAAGILSVSDLLGNNNRRLDPGETADIRIAITNTGDFDATDANATIASSSQYVTLNSTTSAIGTLTPGQTGYAVFNVTISNDAPIGTPAPFDFNATAGLYSVSKSYVSSIGLILEDWESGGFSQFNWTSGGDAGWEITSQNVYEGVYMAKSGTITDYQSSELLLNWEVGNNDSISFFRKVSSEPDYDYLKFYIDGNLMDQWSGEEGWARKAYPVTAGSHTFKWEYSKDVSQSTGSDAAWVDYIVLPPFVVPTMNAGEDATICAGSVYALTGTGSNYNSVEWSTMGDGSFDDATSLITNYTPGANDIANGSVILTLTGIGNMGNGVDHITLTIYSVPGLAEIPAGISQLCAATDSTIYTIAELPQATSYNWQLTPAEAGSLMTENINATIYWNEAFNGTATLSVEGINECGAGGFLVPLNIMINPLPTAIISSSNTEVCKGEGADLSIALTGTAPWKIVMNNAADTLVAEASPFVKTITPEENTEYSIIYISDANGCTNTGTNTWTINVNPLPVVDLGQDTAICFYHQKVLNAGSNFASYLWSDGSTGQTLVVDSTNAELGENNFSVTVTDAKGCQTSDTIVITLSGCEGIDDISPLSTLQVYPNPSKGIFTIAMKSAKQTTVEMEVHSADGKSLIKNETITFNGKFNKTINLTGNANGVYLLVLKYKGESITHKLMIQ